LETLIATTAMPAWVGEETPNATAIDPIARADDANTWKTAAKTSHLSANGVLVPLDANDETTDETPKINASGTASETTSQTASEAIPPLVTISMKVMPLEAPPPPETPADAAKTPRDTTENPKTKMNVPFRIRAQYTAMRPFSTAAGLAPGRKT
jgi:hypothetical protein